MQSMKSALFPSLGARRAKGGFGHRATWLMVTLAALFAVLAVAVPTPRSASAADPEITLSVTEADYETATLGINVTDVDSSLNWRVNVVFKTDAYEHPHKNAGPTHTVSQGQESYSFDYDVQGSTVTADVYLNWLIPASDYTVEVKLCDTDCGSRNVKAEASTTFSTKSGCTPHPTNRGRWFPGYHFTEVTENELTVRVHVNSSYAPLNSGRCVYYTYNTYFENDYSEILTAYIRHIGSGGRTAQIELTDLDPGTRYGYHITLDKEAEDNAAGFSGSTLGPNTGISDIVFTNITNDSAKATATVKNASTDDKFVYWRYRESPLDGDPGIWLTLDKVSTKTSTADKDLNYLDAGTRYEVEASVKDNFNLGMSMTRAFVTLPGKPGISPLEAGDGSLKVTWTAPTEGAATITGYTVKWQESEEYFDYNTFPPPTLTLDDADVDEDDTSYTITGLTNGTEYIVHVIAKNESGGTESNGEFGTPMSLPNAPNNLQVAPGNEKLTLTWEEPTAKVGVTVNGYKVQWKADSVTDWDAQTGVTEVSESGLTREITSLTNGTTYDVRVRAENGVVSDSYNWVVDDGIPRPAPIVTEVTVADSTITQTEATATVAIDNQTGDSQTVHLRHRVNTPGSSWKDEPTKSAAPADTSVNFGLSSLAGNTEHVVEAWLAETPGTTKSTTFTTDPVPPGVPTNTTVKPGVGTLKLEWDPPAEDDNGGATIDHYVIEWDEYDGKDWNSPLGDATTTGETYDIRTLTNRTRYAVRIRADNLTSLPPGKSYNWVEKDGTPRTIPAEPIVEVTPDNARLHVSWNKPDDGGEEISGFVVQYKKNADSAWLTHAANAGSNTLKTTIPDLDNGELYDVRVRAFNSATVPVEDDYNWGEDDGTPRTIPAEPVLTVTAGNAELEVSWDEPDDGGDDITDHVVQYKKNTAENWTASTAIIDESTDELTEITSYKTIISNLDNGETYLVRVRAVNSVVLDDEKDYNWGTGSGKPITIPGLPTVRVTPGNAQLEVNWNKPDAGGDTITGFVVQYMKDTDSGWTDHSTPRANETTTTITGLDNGDLYTVRVRAVNTVVLDVEDDYNWGEDSNKPRTIPNAPDSLTVTHGSQQLTATWEKPTGTGSDGGDPITGYEVQWKEKSSTGWASRSFKDVIGINTLTLTFSQHSGHPLTNGTSYTVRVRAVNTVVLDDEEGYNWEDDDEIPSTTPGAPQGVGISDQGNAELTVAWSAPSEEGGSDITGYVVQWRVKGIADWAATSTTEAEINNANTFTHTFNMHLSQSLANGVKYEVRVIAKNSNGRGTPSPEVEGKPRTTPNAPDNLQVTEGNTELVLTWTAPTETGGVTITIDYYFVEYKKEGENSFTSEQTDDATEGWTLDGLDNGKLYTIQVKSYNSEGDTSEPSGQATGKPRTIPGKPTITGITVGNGTLTVAWTAPTDNGGADPTKYIIEWEEWIESSSNWQASGSDEDEEGSPYEIGSLTNGTKYRVVVKAVNDAGPGPASDPKEGTPKTIPDAPTVELTPGDEELKVEWNKPGNGGDDITGFKVQYKKDTDENWTELSEFGGAVLETTITNLDNGDPYMVWVRAVNSAEPDAGREYNWGKASDIPRTVPTAPTVSLTHGNEELKVTWDKPDDGGDTITGFVVQYKKAADTAWIGHSTPGKDDTTTTITSLDNGVPYDVRVRAINTVVFDDEDDYKWGKKSETPRTIPEAPTDFEVVVGDEELTLSWVAPTTENNGGAAIKQYVVQWKSGNEDYDPNSNRQTTTTLLTKVLADLSNGTLYSIRVRADNGETVDNDDDYKWAEKTGMPMTVPGGPTMLRVDQGNLQLVVSWVAPEETGGDDIEIDHFVIQWQVKGGNWSSPGEHTTTDETVLTDTITTLLNGTDYDIRVAAANSMSESDNYIWAYTSGKPRTIPGPPRSLSVTAGDGQLTLSWVAPSDDGGLTINRYVVQWKSDSDSQQYNNIVRQGTTSSLSYTIRGLTNDDLHSVRVRADNTVILPDEESYNWAPETGTPVATPNPPPPPPPQNNNPPPQRSPPPPNNPPPQNTPEVLTPNISSVRADNITKTTARAVVNIDHHDGTELTVELRYQLKADVQDWTTDVKTAEATSRTSPATKSLENLDPGTKYVLQASFDDTFPDDATQEYTFRTERQPSIQSVSVSNIGRTSARATINIANSDGSTQTAKLQYRATSPQGQWSTPPLEGTSTDATAVIDLDSLTADTDYEVQAWLATDETDKKTATFRTSQSQQQRSPVVQKPSISSVTFINIMRTSAVTNVSIRNAGTAQKTARLHYRADGTTDWSTPPKFSTTKSSGTTIALTGLTAGTTYEVQVWLNSGTPPPGTQIYEFTTLDEVVSDPSISNLEFENIGQTSATTLVKIDDAGTDMKEIYLKHSIQGEDNWSMLPTPTTTYRDSASIALDGLQEQTTYEVAVALSGDFNGMTIGTFTTLAGPSLSGVSISGITQTSAVATLNIADAGTAQKTVSLRHRRFGETEWDTARTKTTTDKRAAFDLTGLSPQTKYEVEAALSSDFTDSATATFTTLSPDPSLSNVIVRDMKQTTATAAIEIADPRDTTHTVYLHYRTTPQGEWSETQTANSNTVTIEKEESNGEISTIVVGRARVSISGLTADTEYEVQVSLDSEFGDTVSATFTTLRYPSISDVDVTDITKTTATSKIDIADPDGSSQTIHLHYRTTTPQGDWSGALTTTSTTAEAFINLTGLITDTEYEVEVSLTSDFTVAVSDTFRTLPPDPVVSKVSVNSIRQTTATAAIDIANTNGSTQTVSLRYRTTTPRGNWSGIKTATSTTDSASIDLSGLNPGTEYDVQASLDDSFPATRTKSATFTTLRWPSIASFEAENIGMNGATVSATIEDSRGVAQTVYVRHRATGYIAWRSTQQMDSVDDIASLRLRGLSSGTEYTAEASLDNSFPDGGTRSVTFTTKERDDEDAVDSDIAISTTRTTNVPLLGFTPQMLRFVAIEGGDNPAPQAFSVWNRAHGSMSFNLSNHEEWLSQQPMSGVSNGSDDPVTITASVDSSELASGQYVDVINIDVTSSGKSPGQVIVILDVLPPDYIRQFVSRDEGGIVVLPDGTVKIVVEPESPPKDVDIELMKVNLQAHGQPPGEQERVVVAIESNTYEPGGDTPEDVAYAPYVELWVQLPEEDAAACDEGKTRVYSVETGTWSLVEHRCETDESDKVWVVAQVERLGAFALVIDDAPVSPTPTPVAAAVAATATAIPASAPAVAVQRISLPAQPPTPTPISVPTPVPMPNGKTTVAPAMAPTPTPTAVPAGNEPSAPMMQASAGDGGSGGFGRIILAALGVPMLIGTLIVVYLLYRERRRRDDARMI